MVIEAGTNTFSLVAHPRLTVIAGVGPVERDALIGELLGSLGSSRPGVHAEVVDDHGRRLAIFRPRNGRHLVVDIDQAVDVSDDYRTAEGRLDLLAHEQIDHRTSRRFLRLTRSDLAASAQSDELVRRLAGCDQTELWSAAARVRVTDDVLSRAAEAAGSAPEDAEVVEEVEQRHQAVEAAIEVNRRVRRSASLVAGATFLVGMAIALMADFTQGLLVLAMAGISVGLAIVSQVRLDRSEVEEQSTLQAAGASSYLGFHLQRLDGMLTDGTGRRRLMAAASDHREAANRWAELAGDVSVDWALEHHDEIVAAAKVERDVAALDVRDRASSMGRTADLAHALVGRLTRAGSLGRTGESFPLILDEPFAGLDPEVKASLLELVSRSAGSPQVLLLTEDEDVAQWARLEAMSGSLSVFEPMPESEDHGDEHLAV